MMEVADEDRFLRTIMFVSEKQRAHMENEKTFITLPDIFSRTNKQFKININEQILVKIFCICILYWQYKNLIDPFIVKIDRMTHSREW